MSEPNEIEGWTISETTATGPARLVHMLPDELVVAGDGRHDPAYGVPLAVVAALLRARGWTVVEPETAGAVLGHYRDNQTELDRLLDAAPPEKAIWIRERLANSQAVIDATVRFTRDLAENAFRNSIGDALATCPEVRLGEPNPADSAEHIRALGEALRAARGERP